MMRRGRHVGAMLLLLAASGCDWIGRQADALGEHMPVVGDRCEHWQCITASGEAESNAIKAKNGEPVTPPAAFVPDATVPPAVSEHHVITAAPQ